MKRSRLKPRGKRSLRPTKLTRVMEMNIAGFWDWWSRTNEIATRICLLRKCAKIVVGPRIASRYAFDRQKRRVKLGKCVVCGEPATDRHHIFSLQNGGVNHPRNIVNLCAEHHQAVHDFPIGVKR